jgi:hypothetical protein
MPALSAQQRQQASADVAAALSELREPVTGLTKADIVAAAGGLDDWLVANTAAVNAAIPQPARGALTAAQKARLLEAVVRRRFITGA